MSEKKEDCKAMLDELEKLTENNGRKAHEYALLVAKVFNDPQFLEHHSGDVQAARAYIRREFAYGAAPGTVLFQMITAFPDLSEWEDGMLLTLRRRAAVKLHGTFESKENHERVARACRHMHELFERGDNKETMRAFDQYDEAFIDSGFAFTELLDIYDRLPNDNRWTIPGGLAEMGPEVERTKWEEMRRS